MLKKNLRRGGYIAPYSSSPNSSEYMLNSTVNVDAINNINYSNDIASGPEIYFPPSTPGMRGGAKIKESDKMELDDIFYYSMDGGCACNSGTTGGSSCARRGGYYSSKTKKGGDFILTPFISALALLGARMLADKNSGFNMSELMSSNSKKGGKKIAKRRGGTTTCARGCA